MAETLPPEIQAGEASGNRLFTGLSSAEVDRILSGCDRRALVDGEVLLEPGRQNHTLFILTRGQLDIYLDRDKSPDSFPVAVGECVGEMSIIDGRPTSAYVISAGDSEVLLIADTVFWSQLANVAGVVRNLWSSNAIR